VDTLINSQLPSKEENKDWRKTCFVNEFLTKADSEVCLMGWLQEVRKDRTTGKSSLKMVFRDSTGTTTFDITNKTIIKQLLKLDKESVLALKVQNETIKDMKIIAKAKQPPILPGSIRDHSSLDLVIHRPYALRTEKMVSILKIQDRIFAAARNFFEKRKFYELRPPIIGPATDPGIRGANTGEFDFYGKKYKLTTSMILYKQMAICSLEKIYSFAPNVRLEEPEAKTTGRHLVEFCQIDVEQAFIDYYDAMSLGEDLLVAVLTDIKNNCQKELTFLERELTIPITPFDKITHFEAIKFLQELGFKNLQCDLEIPWEAEKRLSQEFNQPFWIIDYPSGSRGFYDKQNIENPNYLKDFDLMYPEGYGEAISGSEREFQYELVKRKMIKQNLSLKEYQWYLEMLQRGVPPSAGFGLGVERLTRYICGLDKIWEAAAFPKVPGVHSP
jgi:asparaginyl-tRNA synthetase